MRSAKKSVGPEIKLTRSLTEKEPNELFPKKIQ